MDNKSTVFNIKLFFKSYPFALILIAAALWLRFTINYNTVSPEEANSLLAAKALFNGAGGVSQDISFLPSLILGVGEIIGGFLFARIIALVFGLFSIWMFFIFAKGIVKDTVSALLATIMFSLTVPFTFLSKSASGEILGIAFFTAFLAYNQIKLIKSDNKLLTNVFLSLLYTAAVMCDINIIVFLPFFLLSSIGKNKKLYVQPIIFTFILLILYILLSGSFSALASLFASSPDRAPFGKLIISLLQFIIVPLVLFLTLWSEKFRFEFSGKQYLSFFGLFLLVIILVFIKGELSATYLMTSLSLIWILPFSGVILKDYLFRHANTRMAVWFILFASAAFTFYQVNTLEKSYVNTAEAAKKVKESSSTSNVTILGENIQWLKYTLFPGIKSESCMEIKSAMYYIDNPEEERRVIETAMNGGFDYLVLDGLINQEIGERIRSAISVRSYRTMLTEEYKLSSVRYKSSEGDLIIYKLR